MLTKAYLRDIIDRDPAELKREVLEFNYVLLAQRGVGAHAAILLHTARRDGRKTVRIDELLADAERRHKEDLVPVGLDEPQ